MHITTMRALPWFLAIGQGLGAVTWTRVGCDNWYFQGKTIDEIWANSLEMIDQAQAQINAIPTKAQFSSYTDLEKNAGSNAEFMWGVSFKNRIGLTSSGQTTLNSVRSMYTNIKAAFQGTLTNSANKDYTAYLFCEANGMVETPIPNNIGGPSRIWHAEIPNGDEIEYVALSTTGVGAPKPCTEVGDENRYAGKTFTAQRHNGQGGYEDLIGIILCPGDFSRPRDPPKPAIPVSATLDLGYTTVTAAGDKWPYVGRYNSLSGTLLHEMMHVTGRIVIDDKYRDTALGFIQGKAQAKSDQAAALINPDAYRVFAEMSMSPGTRWGSPKPIPTSSSAAPGAQATS